MAITRNTNLRTSRQYLEWPQELLLDKMWWRVERVKRHGWWRRLILFGPKLLQFRPTTILMMMMIPIGSPTLCKIRYELHKCVYRGLFVIIVCGAYIVSDIASFVLVCGA